MHNRRVVTAGVIDMLLTVFVSGYTSSGKMPIMPFIIVYAIQVLGLVNHIGPTVTTTLEHPPQVVKI